MTKDLKKEARRIIKKAAKVNDYNALTTEGVCRIVEYWIDVASKEAQKKERERCVEAVRSNLITVNKRLISVKNHNTGIERIIEQIENE